MIASPTVGSRETNNLWKLRSQTCAFNVGTYVYECYLWMRMPRTLS